LRTLEFRNPAWIPCRIVLSPVTWQRYREQLAGLVGRFPMLFGDEDLHKTGYDDFPPVYRHGYFRDNWGCLWHTERDGLEGQVVENPLEDWAALAHFKPPDATVQSERGDRDWIRIKTEIEEKKRHGLLTVGDGERLFDRLYFLRGFENLMIDIATDDPNLTLLVEMLTDYELSLAKKWLALGVDAITFHTDIGTQQSLMISPDKFRRHIKPMFKEIFATCRQAGVHVLLSSDGCLLEIVDDLVECGVSLHDPQLRANTMAGIAAAYKGKLCVNLDLDRQMFPFCRPGEIKNQVKEAVETLADPAGGLMLLGSIWGDDVPLENIEALCQSFTLWLGTGMARGERNG